MVERCRRGNLEKGGFYCFLRCVSGLHISHVNSISKFGVGALA
jgi:hypothetical protein